MKRKLLSIIKNVGSYFPGFNEYNSINQVISEDFHWNILGRVFLTSVYLTYGIATFFNGALNPKEWPRQDEGRYNEIQKQIQYQHKIDSIYQTIFQEVHTINDSIGIVNEYKISHKLILNLLFKDKVRIVNSLEIKNKWVLTFHFFSLCFLYSCSISSNVTISSVFLSGLRLINLGNLSANPEA